MMTFSQWILAVARIGVVCGIALLVAVTPPDASADKMMDGVVAAKQVCGLLGGGSDSKVTREAGSGRISTVATCKTAAGEYYCVIGNAGHEQCFAGPFPPVPAKARTANDAGPHVAPGEVIEASDAPDGGMTVKVMVTAVPEEQVVACEALGGIGTIVTNGSTATVEVHCRGGVLDGTTCIVGHYDTYCTFYRVTADPTVLDGVTPDTLPDVREDPAWEGEIVVYNQSGPPVDSAAIQTALCGLFGGSGKAGYDFDEEGNETESRASCTGGLLDGMLCQNYPDESICLFRAVASDSSQVDPSAGNEVPAESAPVAPSPTAMPTEIVVVNPTPTVEPTIMPTSEPTMEPTEMPVEPTAEPTIAPPNNDNAVPPGEAEDPVLEPTPTVVVLT